MRKELQLFTHNYFRVDINDLVIDNSIPTFQSYLWALQDAIGLKVLSSAGHGEVHGKVIDEDTREPSRHQQCYHHWLGEL